MMMVVLRIMMTITAIISGLFYLVYLAFAVVRGSEFAYTDTLSSFLH